MNPAAPYAAWQTYPDTFTIALDSMFALATTLFEEDEDTAAVRLGSMCAWKCMTLPQADTARALGMMNRTALRYQNMGMYDHALARLREMEGICDLIPWWRRKGNRPALMSLGQIYGSVGDLDKSLYASRMGYEVAQDGDDPVLKRKSAMTLCMSYVMARSFEEAMPICKECWQRSLEEHKSLPHGDPALLHESANLLGQVYMAFGDFDSAMVWMDISILNARLGYGAKSYDHSSALLNKARMMVREPLDADSVIRCCRFAIEAMPVNHPAYGVIHDVYIAPTIAYAAAASCDERTALAWLTLDTVQFPLDHTGGGDPTGLLARLAYEASAVQELHRCTGKIVYGTYAAKLHEENRRVAMLNLDELDAAGVASALGQNLVQNSQYLDLLSSLHRAGLTSFEHLAEVMDERRSLDLRRFQQFCAASDPRAVAAARELQERRAERISRQSGPGLDANERDRLNSVIDSLQELLKRTQPSFTAPVSVGALARARELAGRSTGVLTYALGDTSLHVLAVFPDTSLFLSKTLRATDKTMLAALSDSLRSGRSGSWQQESLQRAGDLLLGSLPVQGARELLVIPEAQLAQLPFEVLPVTAADGNQTLLGDLATVHYEYALVSSPDPSRSEPVGELLAIAPEFEPIDTRGVDPSDVQSSLRSAFRDAIVPLAHNTAEVEGLLRIFSGRSITGGGIRSDEVAMGAAQPGDVLHFATHAFCDPVYPERSAIVLSSATVEPSAERGTTNAGALIHEYEIQSLPIRADMVVLSACETGIGKELAGEGTLSLARAFRVAGVPNIVSSLWKVDDLATKEIMVKFYEHLAEGMGKADALAEAKRWYRKEYPSEPPSKWAAFILIGDNEPVRLKKRRPVQPWLIGGGLAAVIAALAARRRRMRRAA
ncbi:MAG: CHAT domain-containing protein [Flavobacteriales bacterium]|nr:CHAT domain-containing protein [Flavobacteriales bacterium]